MDKGKIIRAAITAITIICIASYIWLLITLFFGNAFISAVLIPAAGFIICSGIRYIVNAPRPYENGDTENLLGKTTTGKSFPSRHVFSIFIIAMAVLAHILWLGIVLLLLGAALSVLRVVAKVHYIKDVVAGAALAVAIGSLCFFFR